MGLGVTTRSGATRLTPDPVWRSRSGRRARRNRLGDLNNSIIPVIPIIIYIPRKFWELEDIFNNNLTIISTIINSYKSNSIPYYII